MIHLFYIIFVIVAIVIIFVYCSYENKNNYLIYNVKEYPILTIALFACNRYNYLNQTLEAFFPHLNIYEKDLTYNFLYFDQGTVERDEVIQKYKFKNVFLYNPSGMQLTFDSFYSYLYTDYVLLLEEDWVVNENVEKEILHPSFLLESIYILKKVSKIYGVVLRETDHFEIHETMNVTTKMGNHTLYIGLLKLKFAYTNGATLYRSKALKEIDTYVLEKDVSDIFLNKGYKLGFTYKGRNGTKDDIHFQHVMDHIGFHTSKSAICSNPLY